MLAVLPIPRNLVECFYILLAHDAAQVSEVAFCANPRCLRPFVRERRNRLFCCRDCANGVMGRRHYHKKKASRN